MVAPAATNHQHPLSRRNETKRRRRRKSSGRGIQSTPKSPTQRRSDLSKTAEEETRSKSGEVARTPTASKTPPNLITVKTKPHQNHHQNLPRKQHPNHTSKSHTTTTTEGQKPSAGVSPYTHVWPESNPTKSKPNNQKRKKQIQKTRSENENVKQEQRTKINTENRNEEEEQHNRNNTE
ncbi:hypothetical protein P8452_36959 [Trifolium repens]|nr:hypothetical protein P8452_36959 [Trifolium repens]